MKKYVIALDEGTTSARTVLIDREGKIAGVAQRGPAVCVVSPRLDGIAGNRR